MFTAGKSLVCQSFFFACLLAFFFVKFTKFPFNGDVPIWINIVKQKMMMGGWVGG